MTPTPLPPTPTSTPTSPERPEPVGPAWRLALLILRALPQVALSRLTGWLADRPVPQPLRRLIIGGFARIAGARIDEAERPVHEYRSVNEFFVRRLRPGILRFPNTDDVVVSPVDGIVARCGEITRGMAIQAKGRWYSVQQLLGEAADPWEGGIFITIYLAPRHYHRIHTPLPGTVVRSRHIPGRLFPVNTPSVRAIPNLFVVNERRVAVLDTALGPVGIAAVGAFNVGRISAAFEVGDTLGAGADLMAFHLGSTVVLTVPPRPGGPRLADDVAEGREIRAGTPLTA